MGSADGKGWTCQDFETGNAVWQAEGIGKGSLVYADGLLYLRAEAGTGDRGDHRSDTGRLQGTESL